MSNFKNVNKNEKINNTRVNMLFTFEVTVLPLSGMETMGSSTNMTVALYLGLPTNPSHYLQSPSTGNLQPC
jgi:hypothetical protein